MKSNKLSSIDELLLENPENLEPVIVDVPDYRYGGSQEQLDATYQIRNLNKMIKKYK